MNKKIETTPMIENITDIVEWIRLHGGKNPEFWEEEMFKDLLMEFAKNIHIGNFPE
jgi:hypothetical protein